MSVPWTMTAERATLGAEPGVVTLVEGPAFAISLPSGDMLPGFPHGVLLRGHLVPLRAAATRERPVARGGAATIRFLASQVRQADAGRAADPRRRLGRRRQESLSAPPQIQPFLDAGISVAAINYRFIPQAMEQKVEPPVKAPLTDCARALQTIRSKAKEWNIDPTRIGATGGSAGACTSLWLAFHDDLAKPDSSDPIERESTRLTCAAVIGAQTSLDPKEVREWIPNAVYGGHAFGFAGQGRQRGDEFKLLMANREKVMPLFKEYSPIELVSKNDPPIYLDYPNQKTAAQGRPRGARPDALGDVRREAGRKTRVGGRRSRADVSRQGR